MIEAHYELVGRIFHFSWQRHSEGVNSLRMLWLDGSGNKGQDWNIFELTRSDSDQSEPIR